jgi:hypothetical protein
MAMDEIEITLGQRALPSVHGEQTAASAYAGLGARHIIVLADGTAGEVPSRAAAQTAATAALARLRSTVLPEVGQAIDEALVEAQQAVRRASLGTATEGRIAVALIIVVIDGRGVTAARVGKGRVYLLRGAALDPIFGTPRTSGLGDAPPEVEKSRSEGPLRHEDRLLVMTESAVRPLVADLDRLAGGGPAQLAASRLADAARRRGQLDALSVHVIEISGDPPRVGPHPALARISRDRPRTFDPDGHAIGPTPRSQVPATSRAQPPLFAWFLAASIAGGATAWWTHREVETPVAPTTTRIAPTVELPTPPAPDVAAPARDTIIDVLDPQREVGSPAVALGIDFDTESPDRLARAIRSYITKNFPTAGDAVFAALEAEILARRTDRRIIEALLELVRETELKRTSRWASELLPRLYEPSSPSPDE